MRLSDAIKRAAKWVSKEGPTSGIRLVPAQWNEEPTDPATFPDFPAYVMATDGASGIFIPVDPPESPPNVVVDGKGLAKAVTALKKAPFQIKRTGKHAVAVTTPEGDTLFNLAAHDPGTFPSLPPFPSVLRAVKPIDLVRSVVHAAGDDEDRPELSCVHLTSRFTEATDQSRVARVPVALVDAGGFLVPKDLFKHFPRKLRHHAGFAIEHGNAYLHIDEELRFVRVDNDTKFFDLGQMIPDRWAGSRIQVPVSRLKSSVKLATGASPRDWVRLRFFLDAVEIAGLDDTCQVNYHDEIHVSSSAHSRDPNKPVEVIVRGRLLWNSLHALGTDVVTLGFSSGSSPLRLEHNHYVESFWPLIPAE